jgi:uncharacterized repeat protein (TIGR03803 family)
MPPVRASSSGYLCVLAAGFIIVSSAAAASSRERVLYAFRGGSDGESPFSTLIADGSGNLYGTTNTGGSGTLCRTSGCGTVFKLTSDRTETLLYAFAGGSDGANPYAGLTSDGAGNFYGTTQLGGGCADNDSCGTVFKLASDGTETVLYAFQGGTDGANPLAGVIIDAQGNLYGTTTVGGNYNGADCDVDGCGTAYEVTPEGGKTTLYAFQGGNDGVQPLGGVIRDIMGNLYGTTAFGGDGGSLCGTVGCGTMFKIAPDGTESVLYAFKDGGDGAVPYAGLITDASGNLYGTTSQGGTSNLGTVFKLAPDGTETVLYSFQGGNDGRSPESSLIMDKAGNLYGTTFYGGGTKCRDGGCGTVFKLAQDGRETVLFAFGNGGRFPAAGLLAGPHGLLYGTATAGGAGHDGVVFHVKKRRTK